MEWNGEAMIPANSLWASRADRQFVVGEVYKMVEHNDRSENSHNHYFAAVKNGFDNLPDDLRGDYPTAEHLRKKALIKCGYRNERDIVLSSKADAERVAAFMRPADDYSIVFNVECVVREWTAKSQKKSAMDAREFQKSKQDVLDFIAQLLGVQPEDLARSAA
jgi:hypothetical protein